MDRVALIACIPGLKANSHAETIAEQFASIQFYICNDLKQYVKEKLALH